jgi:ribosomal protein S18 acetylase RimI-like enzyme
MYPIGEKASMKIRPMTPDDLEFAASLSEIEGWDSSTLEASGAMLEFDPQGCLIAEEDGERVGMCFGTAYQKTGFIGELIVKESARGQGTGARLLEAAIQGLRGRGIRDIYLDGVPKALPLYKRFGFRPVCISFRMRGQLTGRSHSDVRRMQTSDLETVFALDRDVFGDDRHYFIEHRLKQYPQLCLVQEDGTKMIGYILGRMGRQDIHIGPWISAPANHSPQNLLESIALQVGDQTLRLGVLENNPQAVKLLESLGFSGQADPPVRMVLGESEHPGRAEWAFAAGSPAKG